MAGLAAEGELVHAVDIAAFRGFPVVFERFFEIGLDSVAEVIAVSEQEVGPREPLVGGKTEQTDRLFPIPGNPFSVEVQDPEETVRFRDPFLRRFPIKGGRFLRVLFHTGSGLETEAQHEQRPVVAAFRGLPVEFQRFLIVPLDTAAEEIQFRQLECRFDGAAVHRRCVAEYRFFHVRLRSDAVLIAGTEGAERQRVFVVTRLFEQFKAFDGVLIGPETVHITETQPVVRRGTA